jgi:phage I-like protein
MKKDVIAVCSVPLGENSDQVQVFPIGTFRSVDGRPHDAPAWVLSKESAEALNEKIRKRKTPMVVDYEHQTLNAAKNGQPAPAAGWFKGLKVDDTGAFAADLRWTARARKMIVDGEYAYLSPVFCYSPGTGEITNLLHAALTNTPALSDMAAAVAAATQFYQLEKTLMPDVNDPTEVAAQQATITALQEQVAALTQQLTAAQAVAAAAQADAATKTVDATQYVPRSEHDKLVAAHNALQGQATARSVDDAITAGKVTPALREWATEYATRDFAGWAKYVECAPVLTQATQKPTAAAPQEAVKPDYSAMDVVARCTAEWNHDAKLHDDFMDLEGYIAYTKANQKGLIKILTGAEERG